MSNLCTLCLLALPSAAAWMVSGPVPQTRQLRAASSAPTMAVEEEEGFSFGDAADFSSKTVASLEIEEEELTDKEKEIAALKAAEKFMMRDTGDAVCRTCSYKWSMEFGDGFLPKNTPFEVVPDSWVCPNCKSPKAFFDPVQIEIAGFADNQAYGIGTNTWTESQKSNAIFGGLAAFFLLFMSGYALN